MFGKKDKKPGHIDRWCQWDYLNGLVRSGCPGCAANYERDLAAGTVPKFVRPKKSQPWDINNNSYKFIPWYTEKDAA